jgi:hypothetical protein
VHAVCYRDRNYHHRGSLLAVTSWASLSLLAEKPNVGSTQGEVWEHKGQQTRQGRRGYTHNAKGRFKEAISSLTGNKEKKFKGGAKRSAMC